MTDIEQFPPPPYDPRADMRDEHPDMPPRTESEEAAYRDWVSRGRPDKWPL